jgi:hypothetical protein
VWSGSSDSMASMTVGSLRPKYSGPAIAVRGGGGRSSPAAMRCVMTLLMRLRIWGGRGQGVQGRRQRWLLRIQGSLDSSWLGGCATVMINPCLACRPNPLQRFPPGLPPSSSSRPHLAPAARAAARRDGLVGAVRCRDLEGGRGPALPALPQHLAHMDAHTVEIHAGAEQHAALEAQREDVARVEPGGVVHQHAQLQGWKGEEEAGRWRRSAGLGGQLQGTAVKTATHADAIRRGDGLQRATGGQQHRRQAGRQHVCKNVH